MILSDFLRQATVHKLMKRRTHERNMAELRWIQTSLIVTLLLQVPAVTGQIPSVFSRPGENVTLSCGNMRDRQGKCDGTTWSFNSSSRSVELISRGQTDEKAQDRSDRLSLTENCDLVLKNVSYHDVGLYRCSQVDTSGRQVSNTLVHLSLLHMAEEKNGDKVKLRCSVSPYRGQLCGYKVMWKYEGAQAGNTMRMSGVTCSATVTFNLSDLLLKSKYKEFFKCEVKNSKTGEVQVFSFPEASDVTGQDSSLIFRPGDDATLPCGNIRDGQGKCGGTNWAFGSVELISWGQIDEKAQDRSDRLSLTENCGLVLKNVSHEDVGQYDCGHVETFGRPGSVSLVDLSILHMDEEENGDEVKLHCSVSEHGGCRIVKWKYEGPQACNTKPRIKMSRVPCSATVTFNSSDLLLKSKYKEFFKCEVENTKTGEVQVFSFPEASVDPKSEGATSGPAAPGGSALTFIMLLMRVAELLLLTVITVLLIRAAVKQRAAERSPAGRRSGAAATQVQRVEEEDEDEGPVHYENSVRLH